MTHPLSHIHRALALHADGFGAPAIAGRLGIARRTVSDWISGRLPRTWTKGDPGCAACGGASHRFEGLPPSYMFLLGLYLGDGSIAHHARGVCKLRLTLDAARSSPTRAMHWVSVGQPPVGPGVRLTEGRRGGDGSIHRAEGLSGSFSLRAQRAERQIPVPFAEES
ncbi:MAG: helix-turn-helix domain-containing protein [Actinomycetota bacterium]